MRGQNRPQHHPPLRRDVQAALKGCATNYTYRWFGDTVARRFSDA